MRKNPSKSFTEKQPLPSMLPPLQKRNTLNEETSAKVGSSTSRPPAFVIRKKGASFLESSTTRKQHDQYVNQQNKHKKQGGFANSQAEFHGFKKQKCNKQVFKNRDVNQDVSICQLEVDNFMEPINRVQSKNKCDLTKEQKILESMSTAKSLIKKSSKKRKVQQCKTRKINWGSKNQAFDLAISAIKLNQDEECHAPLQSLKQLYIQML